MTRPSRVSIKVRGVGKSFGRVRALESFTDSFVEGYLHGVIGPDGAGKTTLMRILTGLLHPGEGEVGYEIEGTAADFNRIRPYIGYMPAAASLYPDLSITEHINFFGSLYMAESGSFKAKGDELLAATGLENFRNRKVGKLSGGMYKKAALICVLLRSPSVLILDEPTNGVDPISRREFWELLYDMAGEEVLIILSTSYMDEAERCGRIHLIEEGNLIGSGVPGDLLEDFGASGFDEIFIRSNAGRK